MKSRRHHNNRAARSLKRGTLHKPVERLAEKMLVKFTVRNCGGKP